MNRWLRRIRHKPVSQVESVVDVATDDDLYYCFRLFLRREPDQGGWDFWKRQIDRYHITLQALIDNFLNSQEFLERHFNTTYAYVFAAASQIRLVELDGFKLCVRGNDFVIGAAIANTKSYEPHVTRELRRVLKASDVFLDIGANIGYFSMLAAAIVGESGKVIAFEPVQENSELLKLSIKENGFSNVVVYPYAVVEQAEMLLLVVGGSNGWIAPEQPQLRDDAPVPADTYDVALGTGHVFARSVALDDFLGDVERIDVIKIDIEGAEPRALRGMPSLIRKHRPVIFTEFFPFLLEQTSKTTPEAYLDSLRALGYTIFVVEQDAISPAPQSNQQIMEAMEHSTRAGINHLDLVAYPSAAAP